MYRVKRVYLLSPSRLRSLVGCALSSALSYKCPLGSVNVCFEAIKDLVSNEEGFSFLLADLDMEEEEYSVEIHIPFLIHCLGPQVEIVPIYVGQMNEDQMDGLSEVLSSHFEREDSLFICSTNLCRWGEEYKFTETSGGDEEIFEGIENLDKAAMKEIEHQDPDKFTSFLESSGMQMDGKNPLLVMLKVLDECNL